MVLVGLGLLLDALTADGGRCSLSMPTAPRPSPPTSAPPEPPAGPQSCTGSCQHPRIAARGLSRLARPGSCDEYPFASTSEGGPGKASIAGVPLGSSGSRARPG
jgi:hypothetical protein